MFLSYVVATMAFVKGATLGAALTAAAMRRRTAGSRRRG